MPPTATHEDIKAYQEKVQKDKITPQNLPPCVRCALDSVYFKIHAYRERRFLIIVELIVQAVFCPLVRFICTGCGKTVTHYPDFVIPHKHYTRQSITGFVEAYIGSENITYERAVMVDGSVPAYPKSRESGKSLAPSTVHRWVTTLAGLIKTTRKALELVRQENPSTSAFRSLAQLRIPQRKYRSQARKKTLYDCFGLIFSETFFQNTFGLSIFTKLATRCGFS